LFVCLFVCLFAAPTYAQETTPIDGTPISAEDSLLQDATEYAKTFNVELEEAVKRLTLQAEIDTLNYSLTTFEPEAFGGLYIQHTPKFQVVVLLTDTDRDILSPYLSDSPLAELIEARTASLSLVALRNEQETAMKLVREVNIPVDSALLVDKGVVELYVVQRKAFDKALEKSSIRLPAHVEVVTVEQLAEPATNIYGGLTLAGLVPIECTSGFAVQHYGRELGISTAAHCSNTLSYNGTSLPLQAEAYTGSADVQWHTTPGFSVRNWIYDGSFVRAITATRHHVLQFQGQWVCGYGRITGYGCGNITSIAYRPGYVPNASATYVTVLDSGENAVFRIASGFLSHSGYFFGGL
jgi:hypothetical protein